MKKGITSTHVENTIYLALQGLNPRITSTHVENTLHQDNDKPHAKDHLHTRGEYTLHKSSDPTSIGSPPHTWRIPYSHNYPGLKNRITSTHVENTQPHLLRLLIGQDHLHTRGEYQYTSKEKNHFPGSPPHTWRIRCWNHKLRIS